MEYFTTENSALVNLFKRIYDNIDLFKYYIHILYHHIYVYIIYRVYIT